jgi:hypothetical protein
MTNLGKAIEKMQNQGLEVEVQYSTQLTADIAMFSALILGYTIEIDSDFTGDDKDD